MLDIRYQEESIDYNSFVQIISFLILSNVFLKLIRRIHCGTMGHDLDNLHVYFTCRTTY